MNLSKLEYLYLFWLLICCYLAINVFGYLTVFILKKFKLFKNTETSNRLEHIINDLFTTLPVFAYSTLFTLFIITIENKYLKTIEYLAFAIVGFYFFKFVFNLADFIVDEYLKRVRDEEKKVKATLLKFVLKLTKALIILIIVLFIAKSLGFNLNTLLAGLGLGSIILAFGMQNVLEDVFASLSIYFDRPFRLGDYIDIGKDSGNVTQIGFKTTRLKTQLGDELVVSNKDLVNSRIHNFGKLKERRVEFKLYLSFDTSEDKLSKIKTIIEKIIEVKDDTRFGRVNLREISVYGLLYNVVFYITNDSFQEYMETLEYINLEILKNFKKNKIKLVKMEKNKSFSSEGAITETE